MELTFTGDLWYWRGPPPFHFITVPDEESGALEAVAPVVTYGWGMVPVTARIGSTDVDHGAVPQGRAVHRADQGHGPEGRGARVWVTW